MVIGFLSFRIIKSRRLANLSHRLNTAELENKALQEKELTEQLEFRKRELDSKVDIFIEKNNLLNRIKAACTEVLNSTLSISSESKKDLKKLNTVTKENLRLEKDWEEFKTSFESVYENFFTILKERYPDLTSRELKLCAMVKLEKSMREIGDALGISEHSVKTARYRLRKKLNIQRSSNLKEFLNQLDQKVAA